MFGQMYFTNLVEVFNYVTPGKTYKVLTSDSEFLLKQSGGAMAVNMGSPWNQICVVVHEEFWNKLSSNHLVALLGHEVGHLENDDLNRTVGSVRKEYDADMYALSQGVKKLDLLVVLFFAFFQVLKNWFDLGQIKRQLGHCRPAYLVGMAAAVILYPLNLIGLVWIVGNYLVRAIPILAK